MVATLAGLPDLASSGMAEDGSVWAELSDGRLITIPMAKSPDEGAARNALTRHFPTAPQDELPATQRAYVMNALGSCFTDTSQEIGAWLTSAGYQVMATPPTVEGLKSVHDAAVFYFDSHGGLVRPITGTTYTMWTQTLWSLPNDVAYLSDLMAGRMAYMLTTEDRNPSGAGCTTEWHYSITPAFVSTYMTFVPRSFVFFNGCSGMHPAAQPMRQAFAGAGASVFAGWTNPISDGLSAAVARQLFDLMLAANVYDSVSPPRRPAALHDAVHYIILKGWHQENSSCITGTGSCLVEFQIDRMASTPEDQFALLLPSIEQITVIRRHTAGQVPVYLLHLSGDFGNEVGAVAVDGQPTQLVSWAEDEITVPTQPAGPGSIGPVTVTVLGRNSNVVPITEWVGGIRWREEYTLLAPAPGLYADVTCDLQLRSDIHPYRWSPSDEAGYPNEDAVPVVSGPASHCTWQMHGDVTWEEPSTGVIERYVLSGSGALATPSQNPAPFVLPAGAMNMPQSKLDLALTVGLARGELEVYRDGIFNHSSEVPLLGPGIVTLPVGDIYTILAGSAIYTDVQHVSSVNWDTVLSQHPPEASTPGRSAATPP